MTTTIPDVQSAWVNVARGAPDKALLFEQNWPVPKDLAEGEVLVKVQAAALNPVGYKFFKILPNAVANRPRVAEFDLSGVVVATNDKRLKVGDDVYGWIPSNLFRKTNQGALAQYARVPADALVNRPPNVTPVQAAGLTLSGLTAHDIVFKIANVQSGQNVFINGGSTAVGAFAIQLAKIRGATVTASASGGKEQFVRDLGADEFVDYTKVDLPKYLAEKFSASKLDYIFETVGLSNPSLYTRSDSYLSPKGAYISVGPQPKDLCPSEIWNITKTSVSMVRPKILGGNKAPFKLVSVLNDLQAATEFKQYVADGSIKPIVDSVFEFKDALKAFDRLMTGTSKGKVVVKIDPSVD
ncbi:hypothetical protein CPB84DRAFT_1842406 [Gymnopilus junonius]|uniref:Enoyl reductase (ER) domain-containing protein n=1 Tax=Gymnopilus junonius TaxID=109634 RepID=A0A9P5P0B7_GYMJU|nr:hypothetical protein CPB84DRAFT_1842406 [Gymnopilus junonius]